jgi:predicted RNase H-like HicB family nuclease
MVNRYMYPSIFTFEDEQILVGFPDFPDCMTYGNNIQEAYENAKEVLEGYFYFMEEDQEEIPDPTNVLDLNISKDQACVYIDVWMVPIRNKMHNRSIKKTLTIPKWLNDLAEEQGINYSQLLQSSLKEYLGINK